MAGYYPTDIGYNLENFVFNELKIEGFNVKVGVFDDKEIDFVAEKGDDTIYVQVAYLIIDDKTIDR